MATESVALFCLVNMKTNNIYLPNFYDPKHPDYFIDHLIMNRLNMNIVFRDSYNVSASAEDFLFICKRIVHLKPSYDNMFIEWPDVRTMSKLIKKTPYWLYFASKGLVNKKYDKRRDSCKFILKNFGVNPIIESYMVGEPKYSQSRRKLDNLGLNKGMMERKRNIILWGEIFKIDIPSLAFSYFKSK